LYFPKSPIQDQISVIDACLHNLYDVPRAKQIFGRLRHTGIGESMLDPRMYNSFLQAYIELATKEPDNRVMWIEEACDLFDAIEKGREQVNPTPGTYAVMLLAWLR
jgi:DNA-directed RNA polymerase